MALHDMPPVNIAKVIEKYYQGDRITDAEINTVVDHLEKSLDCTRVLGVRFNLMYKELVHLHTQFTSFRAARNEQ